VILTPGMSSARAGHARADDIMVVRVASDESVYRAFTSLNFV